MSEPPIKTAYLWANGMLMVFGEDGEQIPELQGPFDLERYQAIKDRATPDTEWHGFNEQPLEWPRIPGKP